MSSQSLLPGFADPPPLSHRLFFALFPQHDAAARIAQLARQLCDKHQLKGQPLRTERFHVTLHHLGDYPGLRQDIVNTAVQAVSALMFPPFRVEFDRAESFNTRNNNCPFVLRGDRGLDELCQLREALSLRLRSAGLGQHVRSSFIPHVTLLYDHQVVAPQAIEPVSWIVQELVLVHSLIGQTRHIPLGRWPLRAVKA